jgi:hypothetical protein
MERDLAIALARTRIGFGVVLLLAPGVVARTMTGDGALMSAWLAGQIEAAPSG